jgi:carboxypeptidase PM20D1
MKKLALMFAIFALLLWFVVAIFATLSLYSYQKVINYNPDTTAVKAEMRENLAKALRYETYTSIDSSTNKEFDNFYTFLQKTFPHLHQNIAIKYQKINNYGILYRWKGTTFAKKPNLWIAAQDVPEPNLKNIPLWAYNPFVGKENNGIIYGAGANKQKLLLIAILNAWENQSASNFNPQNDLYLFLPADYYQPNSKDCEAAAAIFYTQDLRFNYVLAAENGIIANSNLLVDKNLAYVGVAQKNKLHFTVSVADSNDFNSFINELNQLKTSYDLSEHSTKITCRYLAPELSFFNQFLFANEGILGYFIHKKLLSDSLLYAAAAVDYQIVKHNDKNNTISIVAAVPQSVDFKQFCDNIITNNANYSIKIVEKQTFANVAATNSWEFGLLERVIKEQFDNTLIVPTTTHCATDAGYFQQVSKQVFYFSPIILSNESWYNYKNGIDEQLSIAAYQKIYGFYSKLLAVQ